ncbi:RING finger and WD repeat domain-containing protein 3 [Linnemannia hyalina]|uniref:RING-type E3 ubiquitin transferase n=1 Tax=Linnemannia hyalina TaxID=64524 RepID=A0A9P7XVV7_9FUNG|nr:RING finger and WD repeat domain-containing protein 3 [Linnemannia hyalina]
MDDDTFDDINEHSFVDDGSDNDNEDNNNDGNNLNQVLQAWDDLPQGPAHAVNQQHAAGGQQAHLREASIPSQDHDFQSQVHVVTRPMVGPERSHIPEPRPQNVETEWINQNAGGNGPAKCPECNLATTRRDIRRIWSKSVVVVDTVEKDEANARAREEKEGRLRCERELANSRLAYEMLSNELKDMRKKHDRQRALKARYRAEVKQLKMAHPEREIVKHFSYVTTRTIPITARAPVATQYLSYRQDEEMLVYSRQMGEQHGIAKVSMRDFAGNYHDFIPVHSKPIKDVRCYTGNPGINKAFILTASLDKTLKVTNALSKQVVLSYVINCSLYNMEGAVWSCCWSATDSNLMYCAVKARQTSILTLDLRNTREPVSSFSNPGLLGHAPIHSMTHIGPMEGHDQEAILCGSVDGAFVYNFEPGMNEGTLSGVFSQEMIINGSQGSTALGGDSLSSSQSMGTTIGSSSTMGGAEKGPDGRLLPVRLKGSSCNSVSFDSVSRDWMATYNFMNTRTTHHVRGTVDQDPYSGDLLLRSEYKVIGGTPVPLSRNSIFSRLNDSVHMAAGSDSVAQVWYDPKFKSKKAQEEDNERRQTLSGRPISTLDHGPLAQHVIQSGNNIPANSVIRDVKPVVVSGVNEYIVTLSDKELGMYRWSESEPLGGEEDSDDEEGSEVDESEGDDLVRVKYGGKRRRLDDDDSDSGDVVVLDGADGENGVGGSGTVEQGPSSTASSPMFNTQ